MANTVTNTTDDGNTRKKTFQKNFTESRFTGIQTGANI